MAFLRKGFLKSARRRNELYCRIDLSIATIISFLLLVIFMVLPQPHRAVALDLIVARNSHDLPNAIRDDAIKISLTRYGTFYFGNTLVRCEDLADMIREAVHDGAEKRIYLEIDARAKYGDVKILLLQIQISGVENISLLAYAPRLAGSPSPLPIP